MDFLEGHTSNMKKKPRGYNMNIFSSFCSVCTKQRLESDAFNKNFYIVFLCILVLGIVKVLVLGGIPLPAPRLL